MSNSLLLFLLITSASLVLSLPPCPPCGSTQVPYPLSTQPNCGDQAYKITCNNTSKTLQFDSLNHTYPITSISPSTQRLVVAPSPFLPNACVAEDISFHGLQLNQSLPFNITGSNTIFYLNCTVETLKSPLNCSANSLCHEYSNRSVAGRACKDAPVCCAFRAGGSTTSYRIRVREDGCRAYRSFVNLDYALPVSAWPEPGVELEWVLPREPSCDGGGQGDCGSGSVCRVDPDANGAGVRRRCFCDDGLHWDPVNGVCAKGQVY